MIAVPLFFHVHILCVVFCISRMPLHSCIRPGILKILPIIDLTTTDMYPVLPIIGIEPMPHNLLAVYSSLLLAYQTKNLRIRKPKIEEDVRAYLLKIK